MGNPVKVMKTQAEVIANQKAMRERVAVAKERIQEMTDAERLQYGVDLKKLTMTQEPRNAEELWNCVKAQYGIEIPYTSTDPEFHSPFEYFHSVYFAKDGNTVALASRGSGKTMLGSIYMNMCGTFRPNFTMIHAAGTKVQAGVIADNLENYYNDPVFQCTFRGRPARETAKWVNGCRSKIVTGSMQGVSGQHGSSMTLDEIEFWAEEDIQQTFEVPLRMNGYNRVWTAFSTRQKPGSGMSWLVEEAPKRGFKVYQWSAFETMVPCVSCIALDSHPNYRGEATDKAREEVCVLWSACRGERAKKATGFRTLEEIQDQCKRGGGPQGREWLTQGLCTRPSSHGLVLFNFEQTARPDGNFTQWEYMPELPWYAVHDPAEGRKSVIYFIQVHNDQSFVFDELVDPACPDVTTAKQAFYEHCMLNGYGDPDVIVVDPSRTDAVATWKFGSTKGNGVGRSYNADTPDRSETTGVGQELYQTLDLLRNYICDGTGKRRLFINPGTCPIGLNGITKHSYPTDMSNNILSKKPQEAYKDEVDALRYWVMYLKTKFTRKTGQMVFI